MDFTKKTNKVYILIIAIALALNACGVSQAGFVKKKSNKKNENTLLVTGDEIMQEETYANIKGTVTRLQAILCGKYTHYILNRDTLSEQKYAAWLVNDGMDSIMHYYLPIADRNREGHWIYIYHYMTSLPDDPTFSIFLKLTPISRDTVRGDFYEIPDDFEQNIQEILTDPQEAFKGIDFFKVEKMKPNNSLNYIRKTPIQFIGVQTDWEQAEVEGTDIKFIQRHYDTKPNQVHYYKAGYDGNKEFITQTKGEFYIKKAMIRPDFWER